MSIVSFTRRQKWLLWSLLLLSGCSFFYPSLYERVSLLVPHHQQEPSYSVEEDGTIAYAIEGLRIEVRYMTDRELNALAPEESSQGKYSYNAYTYGDYIDPETNYVRNRFTVFKVAVYNLSFPKIELQPLQSLLTTNRKGEELTPYGIQTGSAPQSFESYYRSLKGFTGNEDYRFDMRMGQVRSSNYDVGEKIYKGENYGGYIVFDALADEVEEVHLHIRDFILKFNAFDQSLQTFDINFSFARQVQQSALVAKTNLEVLHAATQARLQAPSQISGHAADDLARTPSTIDAFVRSHLNTLNRCFAQQFQAGQALPGTVTIRFVILSSGLIESAHIVASTVDNDSVADCLIDQIKRWRLRPSGSLTNSAAADSTTGAPAPPSPSFPGLEKVAATCILEFVETATE